MKSKKLICGALAATLTLSVAVSGCSLLTTINEEDMKQVIATVDISKSEYLKDEGLDGSAVVPTDIVKRDLLAAFINSGYSSVQSGNYSTVFTGLMTQLTNNAVIQQYATLYMLNQLAKTDPSAVTTFKSKESEVEKYEYLLGGANSEAVLLAKYKFASNINSNLDGLEKEFINDTSTSQDNDETRATPTGVDTEVEDYYPATEDGSLNYDIYTGYGDYLLANSGAYADEDALEGTTRSTRIQAYSSFIDTLKSNYLVTDDEDITDVWKVNYIQEEYLSQLQQQVINSYYDVFAEQQEELLKQKDENGVYGVLAGKYDSLVNSDKSTNATVSSFETNMGSMSDTSFILWAPATENTEGDTFGYVYNILLPFDGVQQTVLDKYSSDLASDGITQSEYYLLRKDLMSQITTTDRRSAWFNGATDYSFDATEKDIAFYNGGNADRKYLFFENNLNNGERYEQLDKYVGKYSYNGKVVKNGDGSYYLLPDKLSIDTMLDEFSAYIDFVLGNAAGTTKYTKLDSYNVTDADDYYTDDSKKEIDYSKFAYAEGKVDFGTASKLDMFVKDSKQYLAMSAVNELQYAYTTDTGVLSQYIGYSVSAYDTSYIKEFEYLAQKAVHDGAGTFSVCAGDYGWHLIYVTDTFDIAGGEVYADAQWTQERVETEGTFENRFYNWVKDSELSNISSIKYSSLIQQYAGSTTVTLYEDKYKDLLELGA